MFREVGLPAGRDQVAELIGSDGRYLARQVATTAGRRLADADAEFIDRRSGAIYDQLNSDPRPTQGAPELLRALSHGRLAWAIATSSRAEQVGASVAALELAESPLVVDGSHVQNAKPAPDLLLLAAARLQTAAADCWYVGDSTWDMRAATAARMSGVGVPYGAADAQQLASAGAAAVTTLDELRTELNRRGLVGEQGEGPG